MPSLAYRCSVPLISGGGGYAVLVQKLYCPLDGLCNA